MPKEKTIEQDVQDNIKAKQDEKSISLMYKGYGENRDEFIASLKLSDIESICVNDESCYASVKLGGGHLRVIPLDIPNASKDKFNAVYDAFLDSDTINHFYLYQRSTVDVPSLTKGDKAKASKDGPLYNTKKSKQDAWYARLGNAQKTFDILSGMLKTMEMTHLHAYEAYQQFAVQHPTFIIPDHFVHVMPSENLDLNIAIGSLHSSISKRAGYINHLILNNDDYASQMMDGEARMFTIIDAIKKWEDVNQSAGYSGDRSYSHPTPHLANLSTLYAMIELIQYWVVPDYAKERAQVKGYIETAKDSPDGVASEVPPTEGWHEVEAELVFVHSISHYTQEHIVAAIRAVATADLMINHDKEQDDWLNDRVGASQSQVNLVNIFDDFIKKVKDKLAEG